MKYNSNIRTVDTPFKVWKPCMDKGVEKDYTSYALVERKPNGENNILYSTNNREEYEKFLKENGYGFIR